MNFLLQQRLQRSSWDEKTRLRWEKELRQSVARKIIPFPSPDFRFKRAVVPAERPFLHGVLLCLCYIVISPVFARWSFHQSLLHAVTLWDWQKRSWRFRRDASSNQNYFTAALPSYPLDGILHGRFLSFKGQRRIGRADGRGINLSNRMRRHWHPTSSSRTTSWSFHWERR